MANQPSRSVRINVPNTGVSGNVQVEYESNSSNSSAARVLAIYVDDRIIDPNSSTASTILSSQNTKTALNSSLLQINETLSRQYGGNVVPSYTENKDTIYQNAVNSSSTNGTLTPQLPTPTSSRDFKELTNKVNSFSDILIYPNDLIQDDKEGSGNAQEYFTISAIEYQPPNRAESGGSLSGTGSGTGTLGRSGLFSLYTNLTQKDLKGLSRKNSKGTVIFPMPSTVADVNGVNWGESYLNPLGAAALGVVSSGVEGAGNLLTADFSSAIGNLGQELGGVANAATNPDFYEFLKAFAITRAANQFVNVGDENEFLARTTGSITNPNAELLFKGPRLRQYNFTYRLTPRNRNEAKTIRRIIRFFKINMLTKRSGLLLNTPSIFFLEYKQKNGRSIKSLNKFKPCALVTFNIDNSAGPFWNAYYDEDDQVPQPISTTIQLSFQELVPVFVDNYSEDGLNEDDDVGY